MKNHIDGFMKVWLSLFLIFFLATFGCSDGDDGGVKIYPWRDKPWLEIKHIPKNVGYLIIKRPGLTEIY